MCTDIKVGDLLECVTTSSDEFDFGDIVPVIKKISEITFLAEKEDTGEVFKVCRNTGGTWTYSTWDNCFEFKKVTEMNIEFKAGESVYKFSVAKGVTIEVLEDFSENSDIYVIACEGSSYTKNGYAYDDDKIPSLYKLNEESYTKLCAFVGEDAVPELPPSPNEIMIELLKGGSHTAMFADTSHEMARKNGYVALIDSYDENSGYFYSSNHKWKYVIAVDSRGNEITELGGDDE